MLLRDHDHRNKQNNCLNPLKLTSQNAQARISLIFFYNEGASHSLRLGRFCLCDDVLELVPECKVAEPELLLGLHHACSLAAQQQHGRGDVQCSAQVRAQQGLDAAVDDTVGTSAADASAATPTSARTDTGTETSNGSRTGMHKHTQADTQSGKQENKEKSG